MCRKVEEEENVLVRGVLEGHGDLEKEKCVKLALVGRWVIRPQYW